MQETEIYERKLHRKRIDKTNRETTGEVRKEEKEGSLNWIGIARGSCVERAANEVECEAEEVIQRGNVMKGIKKRMKTGIQWTSLM